MDIGIHLKIITGVSTDFASGGSPTQ